MRKRGVWLAGIAAASMCMSGPSLAAQTTKAKAAAEGPERSLAWLQPKNIGRNGLRGTHTVALTFDDGPNENTRSVLSVLAAHGLKATFFIVGAMANEHRDVLQEVAQQGHLLGNHSATHARLGQRFEKSRKLLLDQLRVVDTQIRPLMKDTDPLLFRAPYGYWKPAHAEAANQDARLKYYVGPVFWDVGGETKVDEKGYVRTAADWDCWKRGWKASTCAKGYLREIHAKDGGVVLMHAIDPKAADLVREIVPTLQREGYAFVRLDQLKEHDKYKTPRATTPFIALNDTPDAALAR